MIINNPWVNYLNRGYQSIKNSVITRLKVYAPEITDLSESNPLIVLISVFSGIAEMLNYYIDNLVREAFISTARRYSSMIKLVQLVDYRIKASTPASVDLLFTLVNAGTPVAATINNTIPAGTICTSTNGLEFITTTPLIIPIGSSYGVAGALQKKHYSNISIGVSLGIPDQSFVLPATYCQDTLSIVVNGDTWTRQDTLGRSIATDQHFIVDIKTDQLPYVVFGDGVQGAIPTNGATIFGDYDITEGLTGNVPSASIVTITNPPTITDPAVTDITVNNSLDASGGGPIESLESVRKHAPLSIRTLNRAVTRQDYQDTAELAPGVDKASVFFACGKNIEIYIVPDNGGIAQIPLLISTKNYVDERRMIGTVIVVKPAGESYIKVNINATTKLRKDPIVAKSDIETALLDKYSLLTSKINNSVRISDIIATVDNLEKVDYLQVLSYSIVPYARPYNTQLELNWEREVLPQANVRASWKLTFSGIQFALYKNGIFKGNVSVNTLYYSTDGFLKIKILPSAYVIGMSWEFITYPYSQDVNVDDNTLVLADISYLNISITEQFISN